MSSRYCPAQHQSVLKFPCLSITKITKIQGRGGSCAHVHPFCSTSICAKAKRAGVSEHHHNHQKTGEGALMLGGVGLICSMSNVCLM